MNVILLSEQRILMLTDSASDIPDEDLARYGIRMMKIPVAVDGRDYLERESFTIPEFYPILREAREIPITSHITAIQYEQAYLDALEAGYTHIINVTINSAGSNMYNSSLMGARMFYDNNPGAREKLTVYVVDSKSYSLGYGWAIMEAAGKAAAGVAVREILSFLEEHFATVEIYLGLYSLQFAKKSGRISAASAFVGELLGLRPVMSLNEGRSVTLEKLRGSRLIPERLVDIALSRMTKPDGLLIVHGEEAEPARETARLIREKTGREAPIYALGASIIINSGPEALAVIVNGPRRRPIDPNFGSIGPYTNR